MTVVVAMKAIKPKRLKQDAISEEILFALQDEARKQKKLLNQTTSTWSGEKPTFESLIDLSSGGDATVVTGPSGGTKAVNKWTWLDQGTKIRWALMSSDWRSKTRSGTLKSGRGSGSVILAGKRAMQARNIRPRPGIVARGWSIMITKMRRRPFTKLVIKAMQKGSKRLF